MKTILGATVLSVAVAFASVADAQQLPPLKTQHGALVVVDEHIDALNKCDWNRLMAQYPDEVEFYLVGGAVVKGRAKIGELFTGFCKTRAEGGFKGATFIAENVKTVGDTVNMQWRVEADWLAEPYKGADAYVTQHGLMIVQVTTFDPAGMKFKK
ncbi:MAG: nuclear transport factor 2 family protein [Beijerinckiaceae bacterium]